MRVDIKFEHDTVMTRRAMLASGFQPVALITNEKRPRNEGWPLIKGLPPFNFDLLNTGVNCKGLRVIDSDIDDPKASDTAKRLAVEIFGPTPCLRFRKGSARFAMLFRGEGRKRIIKGGECAVEILGDGNQLACFGGHPRGGTFEWEAGGPDLVSLDDLPFITADQENTFWDALTERLGAQPREAPPSPRPPARAKGAPVATSVDPFRRINDAALADIGAWVHDVFPRAKLHGTGAYRVSSRDLKRDLQEDLSIAPNGIVDFGIHDMGDARAGRLTAVDLVMKWAAAPDAGAAARWLADRLGLEFDAPAPTGFADAVISKHEAEKLRAERKAPPDPSQGLLGAGMDWTRPAGIMAEMVDWILATSRRPNRPLAVAAAATTVSALCGRHLYSPTGSSLSLYTVLLGETGVGKDSPLKAPSQILHAMKLDSLASTAKAFSLSAFEGMIKDQPCCLAYIDEMGSALIKKIMSSKASSHESTMKPFLQELWSRGMGDRRFELTRRAASGAEGVENPALIIIGASTPDAFFDPLTYDNAKDGFMNRVLLVNAAPRAEAIDFCPTPVPQIIIDTLTSLTPSGSGNIGESISIYSNRLRVNERMLEWADQEVKDATKKLDEDILKIIDKKEDGYELWVRTAEYAIRLASIHCVSRCGLGGKVEMRDLKWGAAWSIESTMTMVRHVESKMSDSPYHKLIKLVKEIIMEKQKIKQRDLARKIQNYSVRDIKAALDHLEAAAIILRTSVASTHGGATSIVIEWIG